MVDIARFAQILDDAQTGPAECRQLSEIEPYTLEDAYAVQKALIARRLERGERRVGMKMGFTSRAKMVQMGINDMIWGRLTDRMVVEEGGTISLGHYVHPRVEPEIAFLLRRKLEGKVTAAEALEAVDAVAPAMEIIDSRYKDFKFSLEDVVADNARPRASWSAPGRTRTPTSPTSAWCSRSTGGRCRSARPVRSSAIPSARWSPPRGFRARPASRCRRAGS